MLDAGLSSPPAFLGAALLLAGSCITLFFLGQTATPYPAGPKPWPLVGNILLFSKILKNPDHELLKLAKQYAGFCMLWLGRKPVLFISTAEDAKELLDKRGSWSSDRPPLNNFRQRLWPQRLFTTGLGEDFRMMRRVFANLLAAKQSASVRKYQDYEAKIMLRYLVTCPEAFLDHANRFSMSVIFSAVYGVRLAQLSHPIMANLHAVWDESFKYYQHGSLLIDFLPILERLPESLQPWLKVADSLRTRESALHSAFLKKLKEQVAGGVAPQCFGSDLVELQKREGIDDEKAVNMLVMLIMAGSDTTSGLTQSFFKIMAMYPEVLRDAQEELDRVVGPSRLPTWEDEPQLPYIRAVIKEIHRWAALATLGIPHVASEEDTYRGRTIPRGTTIIPNISALNQDPARYGDPEVFRPERFLGDDLGADASAKHPDFRKRDHFHYGFGRRLCQGIFVAEASLYIIISRVLWAFDIAAEEGAPPLDMLAKILGQITKPKPFRVRITPRSDAARRVVEESAGMAQTNILDFDSVGLPKQ